MRVLPGLLSIACVAAAPLLNGMRNDTCVRESRECDLNTNCVNCFRGFKVPSLGLEDITNCGSLLRAWSGFTYKCDVRGRAFRNFVTCAANNLFNVTTGGIVAQHVCGRYIVETVRPTPQPSSAATPQPSPAATPQPSPAATPQPSPAATPKPLPAATPQPSPAATPQPSLTTEKSGQSILQAGVFHVLMVVVGFLHHL